jgi:transcriptional regulator with XRE-family HTH domain
VNDFDESPAGRPDDAQALLGRYLRQWREAAGLTPAAAGRRIGCSASKISRIERGRNGVKDEDLEGLLATYGVTDVRRRQSVAELAARLSAPQWWDGYGDVVDDCFRSYLVLESMAELIRTYEARFVPGLLQTPAYAESVVRRHHRDDEEVHRRVEARGRRQEALFDRGRPHLWAVIDRAALHDGVAGPAVMREQLEFLAAAAERSNVVIQILPYGAGRAAGVDTSFALLRLRGLSDVAYVEHVSDALLLDQPDRTDRYALAMARLSILAGPPADAAAALGGAA